MLISFGKIASNLKGYISSILLLLFVILCFDLPYANWSSFIAILITLYAIFLKKITNNQVYWLFATMIIISNIILKSFLYMPKIEVGEQIYSPQDKYLNAELPIEISEILKEDWISLNQPFESYPANTFLKTNNPWAYSSDSFFDKPQMSKIVNSLNFKDRYDFRVGILNNAKYNYFGNNLGSSGAYYPLVFSFSIPKSENSKELCWTGKIFLKIDNLWQENFAKNKKCLTLKVTYWQSQENLTIYASDFYKNNPLSISINNNRNILVSIISFLSAIIILLLLTNLNRGDYALIIFSVSSILIYMADQHYRGGHPSSFSGLPYMGRGNDGLTHYSFARDMMSALYYNNLYEWLRGSEDIFYMMPGLRYIYGITMPFFGESIFGLLLIISLIPIAIRSILKRIFNKKWQIIMLCCFFIIPLFEAFGFYQIYIAKYTIEGFGAGIAISCLLIAFLLLWKEDNYDYSNNDLLKAGFLLFIAISLRPNYVPLVAVLLSGFSIYFIITKNILKIFPLSIGFSPILLITFHNIFYGNKFVLITNSATIGNNMRNSPERWYDCINYQSSACTQIFNHIDIWISYKEPWYILIFLCVIYILLAKSTSYKNKIIAAAILSGHFVFLFYEGVARYSHGVWLLSFLLSLPILSNLIKSIKNNKFNKNYDIT